MIDFTDEIITKINTIQDRINKKKRVIVFTKLLNEGEIEQKEKKIVDKLTAIVVKN